jgi:bifunctional DNA-binding transcriptional regulator/antitoxin component of YhaV-PrlF toxin-antitoxin module
MSDIDKDVRYASVRVTFPKQWMDRLGWKVGTKLKQTLRDGGVLIERVESETVHDGG